jgi:hypothetical protein
LLTEKEYYDNLWKAKELIEEHYQKKVEDIEKSITNTIYHETEQRKKYLKELEEQAIKTVNALKSAWISWSSAISSSNNSWNSNNTSNVNVNMWWVIINNDADIDAVANTIADRVLLAEKWIYQ